MDFDWDDADRTFREELFDTNPWLKYAAEAVVDGESRVAPGRVRIVATVSKLWVEKSFAVELVREDFYEIFEEGELLEDGFANFERDASATSRGDLQVLLPLPFDSDPKSLSEVRLGREWKISGFFEVDLDDGP